FGSFGMDYTIDDDFNYTDYKFETPREEKAGLSPVIWAALVLYALVFLLGVLGNGAVIWVMAFQMRRTVNTVWFLNLAMADLLCCLALPFLGVTLVTYPHWPLGNAACKLLSSLIILNMFASVMVLMLISMDRCALVVKPVWCQNHRSLGLAWALCAVAWGAALLLMVPTFLTRQTKSWSSNQITCSVDYAILGGAYHNIAAVSVTVMRFLFGFLIPFVVISLSYGLLLSRVHRSRFMHSQKPLKVTLVVVLGFFICWIPYHVNGLILACESPLSSLYMSALQAEPLIVGLAYINSCINPIIYVIAGQDFQAKMQRSLKILLSSILNEESPLTGLHPLWIKIEIKIISN
uniref:G-protein coupled receptors family 1 profile domain-containing protein n=1 Tax=Varanus komodoensis TaxID=61221 RepID=A0A8D2L4G5_VARKO